MPIVNFNQTLKATKRFEEKYKPQIKNDIKTNKLEKPSIFMS